jgi:3-methyladenine DNA glycosylase AlkD
MSSMTETTLKPDQVAEEMLELLRSHADEAKAASYQRFFKEPVNYFGLDNKGMKQIKQDLFDRVRESWTIAEAVAFCHAMVEDPHMEARGLGYQTVAYFVGEASPELLADIKTWLEQSCDNWGLVDNLAPSVLAPFLELHPDLIAEVVSWTGSPCLWLRRGATVAFVPLVKKPEYLDTAYEIATLLFNDREDLMHKVVGWLLREAGKTDTERLRAFLLEHGPKIPRTTVRYAIERFPKDERKQLLEATKGPKRRPAKRK